MRIREVIRPQSPEQQRIAALKANRDRASQALKAERDRQRLSRAQQSLRRAQQVASPNPMARLGSSINNHSTAPVLIT